MQEINRALFQYLNNFSSNEIIALISPIFADLPIFFIPIFLVWYWIYFSYFEKNQEKKCNLIYIFYWCVIAIVIAIIIQSFIHLERPETAITNSGRLLLSHIPDASFPSDHAGVSVAFLTWILLAGFRRVFWIYLPFVILMLLSRVVAGVHWPFDIVAWTVVWIISAYIALRYLPKIKFVKNLNSLIMNLLSKIYL